MRSISRMPGNNSRNTPAHAPNQNSLVEDYYQDNKPTSEKSNDTSICRVDDESTDSIKIEADKVNYLGFKILV